jgi:hypothetical protein
MEHKLQPIPGILIAKKWLLTVKAHQSVGEQAGFLLLPMRYRPSDLLGDRLYDRCNQLRDR